MNKLFSVRALLQEQFQLNAKSKGKLACPFCQHHTLSITKNDQLAKCFHPSCGKQVTQYSQPDGSNKNPYQAFLWAFVELCRNELTRQSEHPQDLHSSAWRYLTEERGIVPDVVLNALIGVIPQDLPNLDGMAQPFRQILQERASQSKRTEKERERSQAMLDAFEHAVVELEEMIHSGNLALFYTDASARIISIRFREPYTKHFAHFKPWTITGVFNPMLPKPDKPESFSHMLLVEGEFNLLQTLSLLHRVGEPAIQGVAVGSASGVDWQTLKGFKGQPWVLFRDNDDAGEQLSKEMQEHRSFQVTRSNIPNQDLDEFIRSYPEPQKAFEALQVCIGEAEHRYRTFASIGDEVQMLRKNTEKKKEFEVNQAVSRFAIEELKERGCFYQTPTEAYFFDLEPHKLLLLHPESKDLTHLLHQFRLNPVEKIRGYLLQELINEAHHNGQKTEVHQFCHYNAVSKRLYLFNGQKIYRVSSDSIEDCVNGTDGVLFLENAKHQSFERVPFNSEKDYLGDLLLNRVNFSGEGVLTVEQQQMALHLYFMSLFFGSILKTRPILCPVAEKGSGKTSLLRRIGQLMFGQGFDVTPLPEKPMDFQVALANNFYLALDNVDEKCKWLNDTLAMCATGGTIRVRTLYTTKGETEIPVEAFVALNSRTPHYRRDDVSERLLLLSLQPWGAKKRPESELNRELEELRNPFMSWLLVELQSILKALEAFPVEQFETSFRIADFASFAYRIAKADGQEQSVIELLDMLSQAQAQFTLETDVLFDCLQLFAEQNDGTWLETATLHQRLNHIALVNQMVYPIKNPRSLGKQLARLKSSMERFISIESERRGGNKTYYRIKPKV